MPITLSHSGGGVINKWGPFGVIPFPHYTMAFRFRSSAFATPSPSPSPFIPPPPLPTPTPPVHSPSPFHSFSQAASSPLPSLTPTPLHRVPPSRQGSIGPVRSQRRGLGVDDPELPPLSQVERRGTSRFQFSGKNFFLTWSQIGDRPNSDLEDLMTGFGARLECE